MTLVLRSRADITLDAYYRVAWRGEGLRFDAGTLARMAAQGKILLPRGLRVRYPLRPRAGNASVPRENET